MDWEIDQLLQMRNLPSSLGVYNNISSVGSGIYDRQLMSAGNYRPPVNIHSAIYEGLNPISSIATRGVMPSASTNQGFNVKSGVYSAQPITPPNASTYMSNANTIGSNLLSSATSGYSNALQSLANASSGFGTDLRSLGNDALYRTDKQGNYFGKRIDDKIFGYMDDVGEWFGGLFNRG